MAAGQGFKTFVTGEVLTSGDVNGYLMQGINVFTNATARDAAITAPAEGQFAFTKDNNSLWYYDGAAWVASGATGDIEGVTAGVGISGGGTSGTVTITNSMATAIDAKGDLVAGTGADTFARLAVGANDTVLTADSTEATGMKWAAPAGGGKLLQVVSATTNTQTVISTTTFTDTTLTATITPTLATSTIYVMYSQQYRYDYYAGGDQASGLRLFRDATQIQSFGGTNRLGAAGSQLQASLGGGSVRVVVSGNYLDSPATTSATTYKIQLAPYTISNSGAIIAQEDAGSYSSITLMEIGA
jgi:hypothetical protein